MDRLAREWIVKRIIVHLKYRKDEDSRRLAKVKDLLAGVAWDDLAPCDGCHLPYEKKTGIHCDECHVAIACSRACDPWKMNQCCQCKDILCHQCSFTDPVWPYEIYCAHCEPLESLESKSNSDAE